MAELGVADGASIEMPAAVGAQIRQPGNGSQVGLDAGSLIASVIRGRLGSSISDEP
jgi:hypothetical protein